LLYGEFDNDLLRINGTLDINGSYQLPSSDGSSEQMLKTDGSGILSWADEIDGDVSNEGSLSVGPGTSTTALIQSNTNGSSDITLEAFTGLSITETGNTITLINTVTDTWRGIDNTPVSGATAVSISSDWASYHLNFSNPHGITKTTIGLWNVENIALSSWAGTPNITTLGTITTGTFPWANLSGTPSAFNPESHGNEAHSSTFLTTVAIDDLFDGKSDGFSIYLGIGAGYDDDESDNNNLGIGRNTLYEVLSGEYNIALGSSALGRLTTGNYNVGIGNAALYNNITGSNNTAIGYQAGHLNTDRTGCVLIGYRAGYAEGGDNKLYIENSSSSSPLIYGDFDTDKVTINDILILTPRSSFPSSPVEGEIFVSNTHHIYCYLNSSWVQLDN
jgi:hypothetical protein